MRTILVALVLCSAAALLSACGSCNAAGNNNGKAASCSLFNGRF